MIYRGLLVLGMLCILTGCKTGGGNNRGSVSSDGGLAPAKAPKVNAPAPITFSLCAQGLPTDGMWKCDPALADINNDGWVDIAALPRLGYGARVWLGDGDGNWKDASEGLYRGNTSCGGGIRVADLNGDGHMDLAIADHCQGIYTFLGDGTGQWTLGTNRMGPPVEVGGGQEFTGAENLDVGDVNEDGFPDLAVSASDDGGINIYHGDGTGVTWNHAGESALPSRGWGVRVLLRDLNQDGHLDLVSTYSEGPRVWLNDGFGAWISASLGLPSPLMQGIFHGLDVGDVNKDGRQDIIVGNWIDGPEIFLQQEDGTWRDSGTVFEDMYGGAYGVSLGDVDLDGSLDLAVSGRLTTAVGYVYGLFVLKGDGQGNFQYLRNTQLPETGLSTAWGVTIGEVNRDAIPDIVYATGGVVATDATRLEPIMPTRLQVWCTKLMNSDRAVLATTARDGL